MDSNLKFVNGIILIKKKKLKKVADTTAVCDGGAYSL